MCWPTTISRQNIHNIRILFPGWRVIIIRFDIGICFKCVDFLACKHIQSLERGLILHLTEQQIREEKNATTKTRIEFILLVDHSSYPSLNRIWQKIIRLIQAAKYTMWINWSSSVFFLSLENVKIIFSLDLWTCIFIRFDTIHNVIMLETVGCRCFYILSLSVVDDWGLFKHDIQHFSDIIK